jgi:methylamine dehydrogenase heavy chain
VLRIIVLVMLSASVGAWLPGVAAESAFQPQQLTTRPAIQPGPNVFTSSWIGAGAGAIHVFGASDLEYKGNMSGGSMAQVLLSREGKTAYMASVYLKRIAYGEPEMVLQMFDVATLSPVREIALPRKLAMTLSLEGMIGQSADGRYLFIQNATPATSVTVVDLDAGKVTAEIPTPGCFGIYPDSQGHKFSAVCGDGTFASFALDADGVTARRTQSQKIFDVDQDPIFIPSARVGADLIFVSFHGTLYRVNDGGAVVKLVQTDPLTAGVAGGWAPGGSQLIGYNKANNVLFIGMHPEATDGSHKDPAKEIWAYSLANRKLLYRSQVDDIVSLTATDAAIPVVYASKPKLLMRYEADPEAKFALKKSREVYNPGAFNSVIIFRP